MRVIVELMLPVPPMKRIFMGRDYIAAAGSHRVDCFEMVNSTVDGSGRIGACR
jgi:hypothetical protein